MSTLPGVASCKHQPPHVSQKIQTVVDTAQHPIVLSPLYADEMVIQRDRPIVISGLTSPNAVIIATIRNGRQALRRRGVVASPSGTFSISLDALEAGGPYTLTLRAGGTHRRFHDVYVGEVWLCSGQSNMELRVREVASAAANLQSAEAKRRIHLYHMPSAFELLAETWTPERAASIDRGEYLDAGHWSCGIKEEVKEFSAIGYNFACLLADSLNCHVGVIDNAVGGSTTENWIDSLTLADQLPQIVTADWMDNPHIMGWARRRAALNLQEVGRGHHHPYEPGYLYRWGIAPLTHFALRGVLWYQGESNADLPDMHDQLFPLLVRSWRAAWNDSTMPFYYAQISSLANKPNWPAFRDHQRRLERTREGIYMIVTHDLGEANNIHPKAKREVAMRFVQAAMHYTYGHAATTSGGPIPNGASRGPHGEVIIDFDRADGLRMASKKGFTAFEVCGKDGTYHTATSLRITGTQCKVQSALVPHPTSVRFAWKPFTRERLVNASGMPCSTFQLKVDAAK